MFLNSKFWIFNPTSKKMPNIFGSISNSPEFCWWLKKNFFWLLLQFDKFFFSQKNSNDLTWIYGKLVIWMWNIKRDSKKCARESLKHRHSWENSARKYSVFGVSPREKIGRNCWLLENARRKFNVFSRIFLFNSKFLQNSQNFYFLTEKVRW